MTQEVEATAEAEILALIEQRADAVRVRDVETAMARVAPDVVSFDVVDPLQHVGSSSLRERVNAWFSSFDGPIGVDMRDLVIVAGTDTAFSHSLNRYRAAKADGGRINMWVRVTTCYCRVDSQWRITHEHNSVPFDPESGRASLDLEP